MPLIIANSNTDLKIIKIITNDKIKKHLESLGITINSIIRILSNKGGNLICLVKDGRLAIDQDLGSKIFVI